MEPKTARKLLLLGALYLAQGLPYGFFTQALPVMLRARGVSLEWIGLSSLLAVPWALKFLWAPWMDRRKSRRGSILALQGASALALLALAALDPGESSSWLFAGILLVNALSATQDIATDGLAADLLSREERGLGNGLQVAGYRVGMILGGGALLALAPRLGWAGIFAAMALLVALCSAPLWRHPELPRAARPEGGDLRGAFKGITPWLALLLLYKSGDALAQGMLRPWLVDAGLSLEQIGALSGGVGFGAGLLGALLGGALINRLGRRAALVGFGLAQSLGIALYALASSGPSIAAALAVEHLAGGMATAALFTCMMDRCREGSEATDYTLQASAVVVASGVANAASGFLAASIGYPSLFRAAALLSLAGAISAALPRTLSERPLCAQRL